MQRTSSRRVAVGADMNVSAIIPPHNSLRTGEDWELWRRIARAGSRFGVIRDILALYRMRQSSASSAGAQFPADDLRVITQGHSPDPRVSGPQPAYADGWRCSITATRCCP
jgi:hypothetical protein